MRQLPHEPHDESTSPLVGSNQSTGGNAQLTELKQELEKLLTQRKAPQYIANALWAIMACVNRLDSMPQAELSENIMLLEKAVDQLRKVQIKKEEL